MARQIKIINYELNSDDIYIWFWFNENEYIIYSVDKNRIFKSITFNDQYIEIIKQKINSYG